MDDLQRDKRKGIPIPYPSNVSVPHSKPQFRKMDILAGPHNHVHVNERKVADQESSRRLTNGGYLNAVMNSVPIAVGNSRKVGNLKPAPKFNGQNAFGFSASRCPPITSSQNRSEYFPVNGRSSEKRPIPATVQLSDDEIQESTVKSATVDSGPDFIFQKPAKVEKGFETILVWDGTRLISRQGFLRFSSAGIQIEIQNREVINLSVKSLMGDRPCCKVASLQSPELKTPHQVVAFRWKTGGSTTNDFTIVLHERHNQEEVTSSIFPFQILELDGHIVAQVFERWDRLTQLTASTRSTRRVEVNRPNSFYGGDSYQPEIRSLRDESFERRRSKRVNRGISYKEEIHSEENKRIPTIPLPLTNNELFQYPPNNRFSVSIKEHDAYRLNEGEFLNDTIIEFYLRYLRDNNEFKDAYFYNSFFYNQFQRRATEKSNNDNRENVDPRQFGYDKIKTWTAKVNVFDYQYLIIPINESLHWYLAIIHNPGALIKELEEVDQLEDSLIELDTIIQSQEFARPPIPDGPNGMELMSHSEESSQMVDLDHEAELDRLSAEFIENMAENADEDELLTYNGDPTSNSVSLASDKGPEPTNVISIGSDVELEVPSPAQTPKKSPKKSSPKKIRYEFDIEKQSCHVMILDSLGLARPGTISALKKYLVLEARHKLDKEIIEKSITGVHIKAPLQPNHCDCGVYVLNYIETFFSNPDKYIRYCLERQTSRLDWFPTEDIPKKRIQITNLISEFTKRAVALGENKTNVVDLSDHSDVEIIE